MVTFWEVKDRKFISPGAIFNMWAFGAWYGQAPPASSSHRNLLAPSGA